jgi:hypothetical protein
VTPPSPTERARPRCTYTLDAELVAWLEAEAKRTGFKMSQIVETALHEYRNRYVAQKPAKLS